MLIKPAKRIRGSISVPGDKSISHRAAMIAGIANGTSRITNYSTSADCAATLACMEILGVAIERNGNRVIVHGVGRHGLSQSDATLDCANSGTTMRLLSGILAGQSFVSTLTGDESLRSRPMHRIIEPLEMMGARVTSDDGRAPLRIEGRRPLKPIDYELLTPSAQVKSCILLAGLSADGKTTVVENEITRDHTERMLNWFGASVETRQAPREPENARAAAIIGPGELTARDISVPGDISSAAYFIAAVTLLPGSSLTINNVGVNRTRCSFLNVLAALGSSEILDVHEEANEPVGTIKVTGLDHLQRPSGFEAGLRFSGAQIPQLIDELPLLAVVGSQVPGGVEIRDARELRVKESDRIASTAEGLRAMGCEVEEFDDGMRVKGPTKLRGAQIDAHGDHRIAMSFAIAGLLAEGDTDIVGSDCVAVSFPEFFDLLQSVVER